MMRFSAKDTWQPICLGYALLLGLSLWALPAWSHGGTEIDNPYDFLDDLPRPTLDTFPPIRERFGDFVTNPDQNLIDLKDPKVVTQEVEYDPETGYYIITEKVDNMFYRPPTYLTYNEYLEWRKKQDESDYINRLKSRETASAGDNPIEEYKEGVMTNLADRLFCGSEVDIRPQGNIDLTFGGDFQRIDNPILTEQQRRQGGFDFDMAIQMNVVGKIGEKLELSTNYNTQTTFDFDNQVKLKYRQDTECSEDDIVRKIEAGNVSFPLRSSLIQGTQRLFGFRTDLQFGRLKTSFVISQSQSQREELQIEGGAQLQRFEVMADEYDENRHFFLTHYNRDTYEENLRNLPQINSLFTISKLEIWVTNDRNVTEGVRDVVAFADLGEVDADRMNQPSRLNGATEQGRDLTGRRLPDNYSNTLYRDLLDNSGARDLNQTVATLQSDFNMVDAQDFTKIRARKLMPSEYSFHPQLGFVSLNVNIKPVDVVGVAFQYTYNGETYQVGEFAQDLPISSDTLNVMFLKMLKSTRARVDLPIWDLMMKNVYSLNAYQINSEDFRLDVLYQDPGGGEKRFFPTGPVASRPLLNLLNLDNLNRALDPIPDGQFDFVPGITINPQNGRVIFPVLEPFGSSLEREFRLDPDDPSTVDPSAQQYVYQQLYDSTVTRAQEFPEFNRFIIRGSYKSSVSSEISLGAFGIPEGSVTVTAGGAVLTEGQDYTIDYNLGRIKIINESLLNSGQPIRVSYEDNSAFGFNRQSLLGARFDYFINDNFNIGSTIMRLTERPFTQKVNYGDDPIANTIYGFDVQYSSEAPWLTRLVDKLPLISTKAPSSISFMGEFAHLLPDAPNIINQGQDEGGVVFIDDFEGSQANFNLMVPSLNWVLASTPRDDNNPLFPEANLTNNWDYNRNRARMAWYQMDPILLRQNNAPDGIDPIDRQSTYVRLIDQREVFPNRELQANQNALLRTLDLAYYPRQRGPYNLSTDNIDPQTGRFTNPEDRWGGIMRPIQNNDFEAANIEFLELWVMSPFKEGKGGDGGMLYIDMGDVSEDILKDSRLFFENGLPEANSNVLTDTTEWSRIARVQAVTNAFDNDPAIRAIQDIGLDGFDDEGERFLFQPFLDTLGQIMGVNNPNYQAVVDDPATDNFLYYRDDFYENNVDTTIGTGATILSRYQRFNHPDGNSPASSGQSNFVSAATNLPDTEDINRDNTLNEQEAYFQYAIPIEPEGNGQMRFTQYTIDSISAGYDGPNGTDEVTWYQLKIPIEQFTNKVGGIQDFRSIRFIRMYMTGFEAPTILRFARMDLVRNQWRRYLRTLRNPDVFIPSDDISGTSFDVQAVNIEENGQRSPYPYVLPPGVEREQSLGAFPDARQNEQSISMRVCNLRDGDARAIFKNVNFDMRVYERLKMFVHAESIPDQAPPNARGDLGLFVRIGSDFERNYYEYEIPLTMSSEPNTVDPEQIWLPANTLDIPLDLLEQVKLNRGLDVTADLGMVYEEPDPETPDNLVKVIGNPSLGQVESIMIGVRNREDDGLSRCAEVWVNELRLTGFDERGGTAGLARLDMQLADLGSVTLSGSYSTIGFGSIDQKVNERSRERTLQYDISGSIALDKFLPSKWGIRLPFYGQYGSEIRTPEFDPYQLDIPLRRLLENAPDRETRDSLRKQAETYNNIKSYNFTNVRKERTNPNRTPMPWDVENFSLTYAFTERTLRDPLIESEIQRENRGAIDYNYARPGGYIAPFQKLIKKGKYLQLIKDFNFNLFPNAIGFRNELRRRFSETTYRFSDANNSTWYDKKFTWDRAYNLQWDLTRSLKLNFTANNQAIIDEPLGRIDTEQKRDSLWTNIQDFGRNRNYQHSANLSYQVPLNKIPILDWIQARGQYTANYSWTRASLNLDSLGNLLTNGQSRQVNIDANFVNFYNKIKYFQKINRPKGGRGGSRRPQNRPTDRTSTDKDGGDKDDKKKKKKNKDRDPSTFERILFRPLMMLRRANFTYSEDFTSAVPGFMPSSRYLGQSEDLTAPGLDFAFGLQPDTAWLNRAAQRGWITDNIFLSQQFAQTYQQTYNGKASLEPFKDFRIDVTLNKTLSENFTEYFKVDTTGGDFRHLNPMRMGTMTISYLPIRSTFDEEGSTDNSSALFETFENNRAIISQRLGTGEHDDEETNPNYTRGYGRYQQDVLIPAFLAAYSGQEASEIPLQDIRKLVPLPNWRLTYNGLSRLPFFKEFLTNFNLTHGYRSTLSVNSFATDLDFQEDPDQLDPNSLNFYSTFEIPDIVISEQFMPLIGVDMRFKKDLTANFDYKRSRQLSMSFFDYQLSETRTSEITVGVGYQMKGVKIKDIFKKKQQEGRGGPGRGNAPNTDPTGGMSNLGLGKITPKHDWNIKLDVSIRDDRTVNHILDQENSVVTRGMRTVRISPSIDYIMNNRLTLRLFYDYTRTVPATSASFPLTNAQGGLTLRFSLAQ